MLLPMIATMMQNGGNYLPRAGPGVSPRRARPVLPLNSSAMMKNRVAVAERRIYLATGRRTVLMRALMSNPSKVLCSNAYEMTLTLMWAPISARKPASGPGGAAATGAPFLIIRSARYSSNYRHSGPTKHARPEYEQHVIRPSDSNER